MSALPVLDAEGLLERASRGDDQAWQELLALYREQLRRMVSARLDARFASRVDASDVVQEALADAARQLPGYLRERPMPFGDWLRRLTWERLVSVRRSHLRARRSVNREATQPLSRPGDSAGGLLENLSAGGTSPSGPERQRELRQAIVTLLRGLSSTDREVLSLRYLDGFSNREVAVVLGLSEEAASMRHTRALSRLRQAMRPGEGLMP